MKLFIVDTFTTRPFGGNPAGVVILEKGEDYPAEDVMRKTAHELRYSETVFVKRLSKVKYELRYFTPTEEVDLCGHATVAAFTAITAKPIMKLSKKKYYGCGCYHKYDELGELKFAAITNVGELEIALSDGVVTMEMDEARSLGLPDHPERLYEIMGATEMIGLKPEIVSTGLPDIIMPVKNLEELNEISPDFAALAELSKSLSVTGVHAFCMDRGGIHARNFAPLVGIDEEAATGTASGALSYYLLTRGLVEKGEELVIIQGEAMGRPSEIKVKVADKIYVGGSGRVLASGDLFL